MAGVVVEAVAREDDGGLYGGDGGERCMKREKEMEIEF